MRKRNRKAPCRKIVLRLPDLDQTKSAVLNSLSSPCSRRNYKFAMEQFIAWYCSRTETRIESGCSSEISSAFGISWLGAGHHQSAACGCETFC